MASLTVLAKYSWESSWKLNSQSQNPDLIMTLAGS
jgi:hypothetical protein